MLTPTTPRAQGDARGRRRMRVPALPPRGTRRAALVVLVPVGAALAFLLTFAVRFRDVVGTLYLNGDSASAPVIAELLPHRAGSQVVLGDYRWIEPLYLLRATSVLPAHRQVWILLPFVALAVALAVTVWTVRAAAGAQRAALAFAALACPAPIVLRQIGVLNAHGLVLVHTALLAAGLTWVVLRGAMWSLPRLALMALGLALVTAPGLAGDQILLAAGLVPFVLAATALRATRAIGGRELWALLAAAGLALIAGALITAHATADGIIGTGRQFQLASLQGVLTQLRLFLEDVTVLGHGSFGGSLSFWPVAHYGLALVVLVAVVLLTRRVRATGTRELLALNPAAQALVLFWGLVGLLVLLAFVSTTAPVDVVSVRYVTAAWPALVVLGCLLATPRLGTTALGVLATLAAVAGITELARGEDTTDATPFPRRDVAGQLARFVRARHLDHGYAGYWSAATLTYQTKYVAKVYPVLPCGAGLCPFGLHRIDAWYAPRRGVRSFVIEDAGMIAPAIGAPPAAWGAVETAHFGQLTVRVYPYDVARRLGPGG